MRLAPAFPLLLTKRGCPLAFDLVDADSPRPQPIIGRATYLKWFSRQGRIWYHFQVWRDSKLIVVICKCINALEKFN